MTDNNNDASSSRRKFILTAGAGLVATGVTIAAQRALSDEAAPPQTPSKVTIKAQYRKLGRTGKLVSKIGVGTASLSTPAVLDHAIDLGLNYIDTAHCYMDGRSEKTLGKILKRRRDEVVLTTKWHPGPTATKKQMLNSLDTSLRRLNCDHVDCVLVHSVKSVDRIQNPEVFEAFHAAKKAGKVSHLGMSSHSPAMIEVIREAIRLKLYDVVLLKYSYMAYPEVGKLIDELYAANIGVTVMKTRDGARHTSLEAFNQDDGFVASALRWASSNPKIASTVISANSFDDINLFARVAGQAVTQRDLKTLDQYARRFDQIQCRWCGDCGPACPADVPVWEVDRAAMYFDRYNEERRGMNLYAAMKSPASACITCSAPCEDACSHKLPIRNQMMEAHDLLAPTHRPELDLG